MTAQPPSPALPKRTSRRSRTFLRLPADPVPRAARTVAFLLGAAVALGVPAYVRIIESIFGPSGIIRSAVVGVFLAGGAVGPWSARRVAIALVRIWAERIRGAVPVAKGDGNTRASPEGHASDGLAWLLQSVLGLLSGTLMLAGLIIAVAVRHLWSILSAQFFWTPAAEILCLCVMTTAIVGLVGMTAGLQVAALYSAASRGQASAHVAHSGGQAIRITPSLLLGVAVGLTIHAATAPPGLSAEQWVLLSAVPFFAIALLSVFAARSAERDTAGSRAQPHRPHSIQAQSVPDAEPRRLILAAVAAWGAAAAIWACSPWSAGHCAVGQVYGTGSAMFAAMTIGAWIAGRPPSRRSYSAGGYGMALWAGGIAIMAVVAIAPDAADARESTLARLLPGLIASACIGHALSYGRRSYVVRCDNERQALAQWCAATLCGAAAGFVASQGLDRGCASGVMGVAAACLILLILGGLLVIHERSGTRRVRRQRIAMIFASLGLAVVALPAAARRASAGGGGGPAEPIAARSRRAVLPECGFRWTEPGAQIACLGDVAVAATAAVWRIDHVLWNPDALAAARSAAADADAALSGPPRVYGDADAWWRRNRSRYDLIVQTADGLSPADMASRLSWEWFEGLRRRLLPRGALLVELPAGYLDARGAASVARTFAAAFESYDRWFVVADSDATSRVYLLAMSESRGQTAALRTSPPQVSSAAATPWRRRPMNDVDLSDAPLNTLRRPAFRPSPEPRTSGADAAR